MQTKSVDSVEVAAGILTDEQARRHFGIDLGAHGIQAIWLSIANGSGKKLWFLRNALDADYFSADEVAAVVRSDIPADDFEIALQQLRDESIRVALEPDTLSQGFVFTPKAIGGRYVDVRLGEDIYAVELERRRARARGEEPRLAQVSELRFGFAIPLPDGIFDYEELQAENIYSEERPDLSQAEFRAALEALPCCASNAAADAWGDPLNVVVIADTTDALNALSRAGWSFTHRITPESVKRLVGASIQGDSYPVAPVSNLYLFGRKQDFALQRARPNISQRNHMRFWLAPFRFRNKDVWVGQVSRDIGIKITPKSPTLTTHIIDPEVDMTREYLLHSLLAEGLIDTFGFAGGSRAATREAPANNLTDDAYFSDGLRLVIEISRDPIPYERVSSFIWEESAAPVAEGQSEAAESHVRTISGEQ
ncbi:hypothetical protein DWB85_10535 [Seongchinamella sediminis]|uniref:LssY-like C-terminal domain-containing protein n=1 Tax=Seongchinamella sediminis TaxID=2283635 RepID=A0A3L7DW91_9GAMM|nr:hypothetical protein DWB85_10535 [Seongchinamella sediminis]